jgi:hypothetical protein
MRKNAHRWLTACGLLLATSLVAQKGSVPGAGKAPDPLDSLAKEFRQARTAFVEQADFAPPAVERWKSDLRALRARLDALPRSQWGIADRVDWYLLLTEMNQQDFEQRVLRPWSRNPGFYVSQIVGRVGDAANLTAEQAARLTKRLQLAPKLLEQARANLTEATKPHAEIALHDIETPQDPQKIDPRYQGSLVKLRWLDRTVGARYPDLGAAARVAADALTEYGKWMRAGLGKMSPHGNMGLDNFNWYLRNVYLTSYRTDQMLALADRDYQRSMANLAYDENRNRMLPPLARAATEREYLQRDDEGERRARQWLKDGNIFSLEPNVPERFTIGVNFQEHLDWWHETLFRDPSVDKLHAGVPGHKYDTLVSSRHHRPIRAEYTANRMRPEGWGFYLEEMAVESGFLDDRPRSREIYHLWQAYRYARATFEIKMAAGQMSPIDAVAYQRKMIPLMRDNDDTAWMEASAAFQHPVQTMYVAGKYEIEALVARQRLLLGDKFNLRELHDRMFQAGPIPLALVDWEMTGSDELLKKLRLGTAAPLASKPPTK